MAKDILYSLRRLHGQLHEANEKHKLCKRYSKEFKKYPHTVFLLMTPEHGNVGDQAIAKAETEFLKNHGIHYIEITSSKLNEMKWANQLDIFNGFPILINGGGNLGTLWMGVENLQREIIQKNPKSSIYFLPNTVFYENNDWGKEELRKSIQIYNNHKHLTVYAREKVSYDFMKPIYRDVRLVPDMVLTLREDGRGLMRKGCLLCLRSDCEKIRTEDQEAVLRSQAKSLFGENVRDTDMVEGNHIAPSEREVALERKFNEFASGELVITDRLHGMIFCAITGTPCIVVDSKSPKLRGCYAWIKHLDYIRFAEKPEDIAEEYLKILEGPHHYENSQLIPYYQTLAEDIRNTCTKHSLR